MNPARSPRSSASGFSLVEVSLAMGIVTFALVAILGLLSVGLDAGRASADDTAVAGMSRQVLTRLRAVPFPPTAGLPSPAYLPFTDPPAATVADSFMAAVFFDSSGDCLDATGTTAPLDSSKQLTAWPVKGTGLETPPNNAIYRCIAVVTPDAASLSGSSAAVPMPTRTNLLNVRLYFFWPAARTVTYDAKAKTFNPAPNATFHASIARYD
jgi:Tfp pilus assembly protein PilV